MPSVTNRSRVLEEYRRSGKLPELAEAGDDELRALLGQAEPPRYLAILGYLAPSEAFD